MPVYVKMWRLCAIQSRSPCSHFTPSATSARYTSSHSTCSKTNGKIFAMRLQTRQVIKKISRIRGNFDQISPNA